MQNRIDKYGINKFNISSSCDLVACYETFNSKGYAGLKDTNHKKQDPKDAFFGAVRILDGSCNLLAGDKIYHLKKDDLFFVKYFEGYQFVSNPESCHFFFHWFYLKNISLPFYQIFNFPVTDDERNNSTQIIELLKTQDYHSSGIANSLMQISIFKWLSKIQSLQKNKVSKKIESVIIYVNTNVSNKLTVSQIAEHFYYSEKYIRNIFNNYIGVPPKKYIAQLVMDKAVFLLTKTYLSISDISQELGFDNVSGFSNCFKKHFKQSPLTYRNNNR